MIINVQGGHGSALVYRRGFRQVEKLSECHEGQNNFRVYELLKRGLEQYEGVTVTSVRPTMDQDPALSARGKAGEGADLQIQLHSNAGGGRGPTMVMRPDAPDDLVDLATSIRDGIRSKFDFSAKARAHSYRTLDGVWRSSRGPGKSYYAEMRYCPHPRTILLEMAFHDHDTDARYLRRQRQNFADAITQAVVDHYGLKKIPAGKAAHAATGAVNFRTGPGTSYPVIRSLSAGAEVEVLSDANAAWAKARCGSDIGYINTGYLEALPDPVQDPLNGPYVTPKGERLYFRAISGSYHTRQEALADIEKMKAEGKSAWLQAVYLPVKE